VLIGSITTFLVGSLVSLLTRTDESEKNHATLDPA
jgi:hypothetical protein